MVRVQDFRSIHNRKLTQLCKCDSAIFNLSNLYLKEIKDKQRNVLQRIFLVNVFLAFIYSSMVPWHVLTC